MKAAAKAFTVTSMPFVLVETTTGVVSLQTGVLSIPPAVGIGTVIDTAILVLGLVAATLRALKSPPSQTAREKR